MQSLQAHRKVEHLSLAEKLYSASHQNHPFDGVRLVPNGLPEATVAKTDLTTQLGPLSLAVPFYIEAMTGGSQQSTKINRSLARLAAKHHLAMATGSMSIIFKDPTAKASFTCLREENPDGLIFANLGAGANLNQAQVAVNLIHADALEIHLNATQETVMAEGDREFLWQANLKKIITGLKVPVIIKEVGFGMSAKTIAELAQLGAQIVNLSGRGGTNFAMIEDRRNHEDDFTDLYDFGLTTPESLIEAQLLTKHPTIIASGGITTPIDVVKALAMGASAVGVAGYFLHELIQNKEAGLDQTIDHWVREIKRLYALLGCQTTADWQQVNTVFSPELMSYLEQRRLQIKWLKKRGWEERKISQPRFIFSNITQKLKSARNFSRTC